MLPILPPICQGEHSNSFHETRSGVAQESAPRLQGTVYANMMIGGRIEVARLWGVVRCLFGYVIGARVVG